jgi:hypothetical protein
MKESLYDKINSRHDKLENIGWNYEGKIFKKSMSPYLLRDPNRLAILTQLEKIVYFLIEKAKYVKNFYNYTVDKNYKHLN